MNHSESHVSRFKRIEVVPHFYHGALICHLQKVSLPMYISGAVVARGGKQGKKE